MILIISFVILPLVLDIVSCVLNIRRQLFRNGPSGIPLASLFLYIIYYRVLKGDNVIVKDEFLFLAIFHLISHFGVPMPADIKKVIGKRPLNK
jgi:hypothetical protein